MGKYLVALDDGHGMETAGKRSPKLSNEKIMHENEFNRAVVNYLDLELKRCGIDTLLVAPTDDDTPLSKRVALANLMKATIYVSIHANAKDGKWWESGGVETYYNVKSTEGKKLATAVHNELIKGTNQKNRGIKTQDLYVLRSTFMPAILIEAGFMDSKVEINLLLSDTFRKECATEIAKGICNYLDIKDTPKTVQAKSKIYKVQLGAYSIKSNAINLQDKLIKDGYKDVKIIEA